MENLAASNWTIIMEMDKRLIKIWSLRCKSTDLQQRTVMTVWCSYAEFLCPIQQTQYFNSGGGEWREVRCNNHDSHGDISIALEKKMVIPTQI